MRNIMIIGSLAIHVLVFGYALRVSERKKQRVATAVVVAEKKKQVEKPKPKPKPVVQKPKVAVEPAPTPLKNAPTHAPEPAPAPVDTHVTMSNDTGPGIDVGPKKGEATPKSTAPAKQTSKEKPKEKVLGGSPKDNPDADNCTEAPTKPQVQSKSSEIEYTQDARANNIEGRMILRIVVAADGSVADVIVEKSVDPGLDAAAVAAVKTWTFKPAQRCGKPMAGGVYRVAKTFELGD